MARVRTVNADDANSSGGFTVYPDGNYIMQITDVETKKSKSTTNEGFPLLTVKYKITEAADSKWEGKNFTAFNVPDEPVWHSGKPAFLHFQFYKALPKDTRVDFPKGGREEVE